MYLMDLRCFLPPNYSSPVQFATQKHLMDDQCNGMSYAEHTSSIFFPKIIKHILFKQTAFLQYKERLSDLLRLPQVKKKKRISNTTNGIAITISQSELNYDEWKVVFLNIGIIKLKRNGHFTLKVK